VRIPFTRNNGAARETIPAQEPSGPVPNGSGVRVVINAVAARMGGAATHLPNFLRTAGRRYPDDLLIACVNSHWSAPDLPSNVRLVRAGDLRGRLAHAAWDQWGVARRAARERADVLISILNFGPVRSPIPQVVFQRNPVYFCPDYLRTLGPSRALEIAATRALARAVMRASVRIITPSAAMREMIRAFYPDLPAEKFRVIPHGFGRDEFETGAPLAPRTAAILSASPGVRLLYVSHAAAYKGIDVLLHAGRLLRDGGFPFTIWLTIAPEDWPDGVAEYLAFIERHNLGGHVKVLGRIPHDAVHRVYHSADLFVYPSLCESFGFPLVEAMASGLPIVAADRPLCREMCGEAAVYYPARDAAALAREITALWGDAMRRARMATAGPAEVERFSWDTHVDAVMEVAREAAAGR
jgi:glycosyltransferase involved in cell wall biosynthesis